jgi:hypothetical protein
LEEVGFVAPVPLRVFRNGTGTFTIEVNYQPGLNSCNALVRSVAAVISIVICGKEIPHHFGVVIASVVQARKPESAFDGLEQ